MCPEVPHDKIIPECLRLPDEVCYFESEVPLSGANILWALMTVEIEEKDFAGFQGGNPDITPLWFGHVFVRNTKDPYWTMFSVQTVVGINEKTGESFVTFFPVHGSDLREDDPAYELQVEAVKSAMQKVVYFLHMLACKNIHTELVEQMDRKAAEKRKKKGRIPLYSYHIVKLPVYGNDTYADEMSALTRTSPRLHFRRGHIRRLASGLVTWVSHCMVGTAESGVVEKHYEARS